MTENPVDYNKQFLEAMRDYDIPKIYANGFITGLSQSDITLLFQLNGQPTCIANLSYTTAKTLCVKLNEVINDLEKKAGREIMVMEYVKDALSK